MCFEGPGCGEQTFCIESLHHNPCPGCTKVLRRSTLEIHGNNMRKVGTVVASNSCLLVLCLHSLRSEQALTAHCPGSTHAFPRQRNSRHPKLSQPCKLRKPEQSQQPALKRSESVIPLNFSESMLSIKPSGVQNGDRAFLDIALSGTSLHELESKLLASP